MLKSSQKIKNFANSNDSVLENVGLKMTLNAGGEKKKKKGKLATFQQPVFVCGASIDKEHL